MEIQSNMPFARRFPRRGAALASDKEDVFTTETIKDELTAQLCAFLLPIAQQWVEHFRPTTLVAECTRIIDEVASGGAPTQVYAKRQSQMLGAADLFTFDPDEQGPPSFQKELTQRDGTVSRLAFHDDDEVMEETFQGLRTANRTLPGPSSNIRRRASTLPDSLYDQDSSAETISSFLPARHRTSLPHSDSFSSLQDYQSSLPRTESFASMREVSFESRPPLSRVPRSLSGQIDLSPIPLEAVPEAPSPTKSIASPPKTQATAMNQDVRFLSPESAKTSHAFATPEVRKAKRKSMGKKAFDKLVKGWEAMIDSAKQCRY